MNTKICKNKSWLCPKCHKGGFTVDFETSLDRPLFRCNRCDHMWTCGEDGGEYLKQSFNKMNIILNGN